MAEKGEPSSPQSACPDATISFLQESLCRLENPSPRIDVGIEEQNSQKIFFVRDNGIGIEKKDFDKISQVFQRLPSAKKQVGEGTGVGLTIVKRIVKHHHFACRR
jgi:light-regulated signal transduction histidine kinase (bacteriophytochrome)